MDPAANSPDRRRPRDPLEQAAQWVARRDRGLSRKEQDEYLEWLNSHPEHAEAMRRAAAALERMMKLYEWQPGQTAQPNPDLFQSRRGLRVRWPWLAGLAAAAGVALAAYVWNDASSQAARSAEEKSYLVVNERLALPDGSRIELRDDCEVLVRYSATERRVLLTRGEAHFTVWKDATRPFVVQVGDMEVVAVGTAFSVRWEQREMEVLVTSGSVKLDLAPQLEKSADLPVLTAGYR
ncbi:MAG TPA: FecR domain-containing protein, partial [Opitutaceae bacterium]